MKKLQKEARQVERKPKQRPALRLPFEPIPLHVPVQVPEQRPVTRSEDSISSPRGVVIIDYGE